LESVPEKRGTRCSLGKDREYGLGRESGKEMSQMSSLVKRKKNEPIFEGENDPIDSDPSQASKKNEIALKL